MQILLDRYILREIIPPFFVALLAFLVFISLELVLSLSDALFARGISAAVMLRLLSYKLPNILTLAAPAGVLLATFLALARLASDRELLAFQALGFSLRRILLPFWVFGLLISALSFLFSEFVVPKAEAMYRRELLTLLYRGPAPLVQENVFFRGPQGALFYVERYQGNKVEGVVVYDLSGTLYPRSSFPAVVTAKEGVFSSGLLLLREGRVLHFGQGGELTEILGFQELAMEVGEKVEEAIIGGRTPSEMSAGELRERIELLQKAGRDVRDLLVEYHGKLAISAAAFVFVLFGAPLGAILGHRGRATGMVVGFLLAAGAQALFLWARTLARRGFLPPFLGGWLPHLVFGSLGLLLFLSADRLRFRGLLLLFALSTIGLAAPPLTELSAEELVVEAEGKALLATEARAVVGTHQISARRLALREEDGWVLEAWEATVLSGEARLQTAFLRAILTPDGVLKEAELQDFSGEARFSGPEKEENLIFSAEEGKVWFSGEEIAQAFGKNVVFTTCPCLAGAPYLVRAQEFWLIPEEWLFARELVVESFGYTIVWLPVYAARLGKESVPFLPEVGHSALGLFLRWSIPWTLAQGSVGALVLTVYPQAGRVDPALWTFWDTGSLFLSGERATLRFRGELFGAPWSVQGRYDTQGLVFSLTGAAQSWQVRVEAGLVDAEKPYSRLPEISISRSFSTLGGELSFRWGFGRYREEGKEGWRTSLGASWSWSTRISFLSAQLPLEFGLDQYPGTARAYAAIQPSLSFGGLSLWYRGQVSLGRSIFSFDATPSQSQVGISLSASASGLKQTLTAGWDLVENVPLPPRWTLEGPNFRASFQFQAQPLQLAQARWEGRLQGQNWFLNLSGGVSAGTWEDLILRGQMRGEDWSATGGVRLSLPEFFGKRAFFQVQGKAGADWSWSLAGEYDFLSQSFVQWETYVYRTFLGCLRVGLGLYPGGFRVSLDVPAFPEARVQFAPLDEGLRLGGL